MKNPDSGLRPSAKDILNKESLSHFVSIKVNKGDVLYELGDKAEHIYYVDTGLFSLTSLSPNGKETLLRVFSKSNFIGYRSFIEGKTYHARASALCDSTVYKLPYKSIKELGSHNFELLYFLLRVLSIDLRISEERFNDLSGNLVMSRIIDSLIYLKSTSPNYILTRKEIGDFCGAKTETVTRHFTKLEKLSLVNKDGRDVKIPDLARLIEYKEEVDMN